MKKIFLNFLLLFLCSNCFAQTTLNNATLKGFNHPLNIVGWGDSLTAGNEDGSGVTYLTALSALTGLNTLNEGVGGNTSSQILTRFNSVNLNLTPNFTIIWAGRNDSPSFTSTLSNIQSMTNVLTGHFLILSVLNSNQNTEWSGQSNYNSIIAFNSTTLAGAYSNNYLDVRAYLISQASASAEDVIDVGHDVPPTSLRAADIAGTLTQDIGTSDTSFTVNWTGGNVSAGATFYIGTEKIYIISETGSAPSITITNCTRAYAGTTAQSFSNGKSFTGVENIHLGSAGYKAVANDIFAWLLINYPNY